jgi:hypothetical protein
MKKNHWVPQSYLRWFASDAPKNSKIWRFSNKEGPPSEKPIKKVAVQYYLYAPQINGSRSYDFEKKLSDIEQLFSPSMWHTISNGFIELKDEGTRKGIALLAAIMYLRNPTQLRQTTDIHNSLVDFFASQDEKSSTIEIEGKTLELDWNEWESFRNSDQESIKKLWIKSISEATWLAEILMQMRWSIVLSEKPVFITSDNPVAVIHPSLQFKGLKDRDSRVIFPLSPTRILTMDNLNSEPNGQYLEAKGFPAWNMLIWRNAIEFMFSPRHPDEVCLEMDQLVTDMGF